MLRSVCIRSIYNMQQNICILQFLQCCTERLHQMMRQLLDKAYRIRQKNLRAARQFNFSCGCIQCCKKLILRQNACIGKSVQNRGFPCVSIAHQRNHRCPLFASLRAKQLSVCADFLRILIQLCNSLLDVASVCFQLLFPGAPCPNAAAQTGHGCAHPRQSGKAIFQLCQLHLNLPFAR